MGFSEKSKIGKVSFNLAMCDCHRVLTAYNSLSCISTLPYQLYSLMPKFLGMIFFSHNTPLITAWVNEMQFLYKKIKIKAKRNTFLLLTSYKKSNQPKYINAAMP